ncbi:MAG: bifunctional phosphoribosylaminoimidazolecarboxamide formyltransferase/IMP cyclohydrolase [Flavobacteriales bacterium]|nr:bifunctional phosphoribosylaminoimidazolecarboxamide formyltransferase/IMP cyclohydrolase [Flavobacteriales bacterium]
MDNYRTIKSALISVFSKDGLEELVKILDSKGVKIYSTGGTQKFIENLGISITPVEELTDYPSILGGRVKTLHPKVFGGILNRRTNQEDKLQLSEYKIPEIDLVVVDLYPFEKTVASGSREKEIIEKIDIGGISLIRAAAKNFKDVTVLSKKEHYQELVDIISKRDEVSTSIKERKYFATESFSVSSNYDTAIHTYFGSVQNTPLRYGENPHQDGWFYGNLEDVFKQLHGKQISYNNLLDIDSAIMLMEDFKDAIPTFAILKHNNACGFASRKNLVDAYSSALEADPVSAFGGVLISNKEIDLQTATLINNLFCEVLIAPSFSSEALEILKSKKNRIILKQNNSIFPDNTVRSCLNGTLIQKRDSSVESIDSFELKTNHTPTSSQMEDLYFANKLAKHTKSNTIVLVKNQQLLASGTGQTSRVDALNQAIHKAKTFKFDLQDAVMASDAFFPFPDCVEIAGKQGVNAVIQPGGSVKDNLSIDYCNNNKIGMVFTGTRHFKH